MSANVISTHGNHTCRNELDQIIGWSNVDSQIARNPLASESYDLTVATPIGTARIERRFNLLIGQQHAVCSI